MKTEEEAPVFDDSRPIFVQLADRISDDILRGTYAEESQVPSTNELAAFLRINPATAGKALNLLVDDGVLFKKRGIGMFVSPGAKRLIGGRRHESLIAGYVDPLLEEAAALGLAPDAVLDLVARRSAERAGTPADTASDPHTTEATP